METITLKVKRRNDLKLVIQLAKRLGITIISQPEESKIKKWIHLGKLELGNQSDNQNLRDLAHD